MAAPTTSEPPRPPDAPGPAGHPGPPRAADAPDPSDAPVTPPKPAAPGLGELVRRETEALAADARASAGKVDRERLEALERLSRLHEIEQSLVEPRRALRIVITASITAAAAVLVFFFFRLPSTAVSGELLVQEMSMVIGDTQSVIPGRQLSRLTITGLDSVRLPTGGGGYRIVPARTVALDVEGTGTAAGTLDLDEWPFPAGTAVTVRTDEPPGSYGWTVAFPSPSPQVQAAATVFGPITAVVDTARSRLRVPYGELVEFYGSGDVRVTTAHADTAVRILPSLPAARSLSFTQRLRYRDDAPALSAVLGGTLTLDDLGARAITLGPGQSLRFTKSQVEIPYLALERNGVRLRFSGEVEGMSTGAARRRNLMPRWLDFFTANSAWLLLGSAAVTLFSILLGVGRSLSRTR